MRYTHTCTSKWRTLRLIFVRNRPRSSRLKFNRNVIEPLRLQNVGCLADGNGKKDWLPGQID